MSDALTRMKQFAQVYPDFLKDAATLGARLVNVNSGQFSTGATVSRALLMFDLDKELAQKIISQLPSDLIWFLYDLSSGGQVAHNWNTLNKVTWKDGWLQDGVINPLEVRFDIPDVGPCVAETAAWTQGWTYPAWKVTKPLALSAWSEPPTDMSGGTNAELSIWNTAGATTIADMVTTLQGIFKTLLTVPTPDQPSGTVVILPQPDTATKNDIHAVADAVAAGINPNQLVTPTLSPDVKQSVVQTTLAKLQGQTPPSPPSGTSDAMKNAIDTATSAATGAPPVAKSEGIVSGIASALGLGGNKEIDLKAPPPPPPPMPPSIGQLVSKPTKASTAASVYKPSTIAALSWSSSRRRSPARKSTKRKRSSSHRRSAPKRKRSKSFKRKKSTKRKSSRARRH